jgi:YARHG domain-containing protein
VIFPKKETDMPLFLLSEKRKFVFLSTISIILLTLVISIQAYAGGCPTWVDARTSYLSEANMANCSCGQLEILRNEIYARHGRVFNRKDLQNHFSNQPWYMPDPDNKTGSKGQNKYEQQNAVKILGYEKKRGCKKTSAPTSSKSCPIYPAPMDRNLTESELSSCSCKQLEILRNEIYARNGRLFNRKDLQAYFDAQPWYVGDPQNRSGEKGQNGYERNNAVKILNYEKKRGCKKSVQTPATTSTSTASCPYWPAAKTRYVQNSELAYCSCEDLDFIRNEIYARHGRIFNRKDLNEYFSMFDWYLPNHKDPSGMPGQNKYEKSNAVKIRDYEKATGCRK